MVVGVIQQLSKFLEIGLALHDPEAVLLLAEEFMSVQLDHTYVGDDPRLFVRVRELLDGRRESLALSDGLLYCCELTNEERRRGFTRGTFREDIIGPGRVKHWKFVQALDVWFSHTHRFH